MSFDGEATSCRNEPTTITIPIERTEEKGKEGKGQKNTLKLEKNCIRVCDVRKDQRLK